MVLQIIHPEILISASLRNNRPNKLWSEQLDAGIQVSPLGNKSRKGAVCMNAVFHFVQKCRHVHGCDASLATAGAESDAGGWQVHSRDTLDASTGKAPCHIHVCGHLWTVLKGYVVTQNWSVLPKYRKPSHLRKITSTGHDV